MSDEETGKRCPECRGRGTVLAPREGREVCPTCRGLGCVSQGYCFRTATLSDMDYLYGRLFKAPAEGNGLLWRSRDEWLALQPCLRVLCTENMGKPIACGGLVAYGDGGSEIIALWREARLARLHLGSVIIEKLLALAARLAHQYVFACTTSKGVRDLFLACGFAAVDASAVPREKWHDYPDSRQPMVLRKNLPQPL